MEWLKDWAQVLGAGITLLAVLVALGIGVSSIVQTNRLKKAEKRERLLNEIIEWATKTTKYPSGVLLTDLDLFEDHSKSALRMSVKLAKMISDLSGLSGINTYILSIASFNLELKSSVEKLVNELIQYISFLDDWCTRLSDDLPMNKGLKLADKDIKKGDTFEASINKLAVNVIKSATELKTKDIG